MLKTYFQKISIFVILGITLLLNSCSNTDSNVKEYTILSENIGLSWLNESECETSCVFGIEPGNTSFDEAYDILSESNVIETGSLEYRTYLYNDEEKESFTFNFTNGDHCCSISFNNKVVERIDIGGSEHIKITDLDQMVGLLDEPDIFRLDRINPEGKACWIQFVWAELRIIAISYDESQSIFTKSLCRKLENDNGYVSKDLKIEDLIILSADQFSEYMVGVSGENWQGFVEEK